MRRKSSRPKKRELAALDALRDTEIDTSEIPEVDDWSSAVRGRFYRATNENVDVLSIGSALKRVAISIRDSLDSVSVLSMPSFSKEPPQQPAKQQHSKLLRSSFRAWLADFWRDLVKRFQPLTKIRNQFGLAPELPEDFQQEVYRRMLNALTTNLQDVNDIDLVPYLSSNIALRVVYEFNRGLSREQMHQIATALILDLLAPSATIRDRVILGLFLEGAEPKHISELPQINLSEEEVRQTVTRFVQLARRSKVLESTKTRA